MTDTLLRRAAGPHPAVRGLRAAGLDVEDGTRRRSEYSYDASNYRVPPVAVVFPRGADDVVAALEVCRDTGTPLVSRGGGTSMAGNAVGPGVVLDLSRHLRAVRAVDESRGTVDVDPGVVLADLTAAVERATDGRMTFAPDPSSRTRATVGGAVGNDACGNHSVRYGRTSDHVVELDLVTSDGSRLTATRGGLRATDPSDRRSAARADEVVAGLEELVGAHRAALRTELGRIPRQVSGYHLHHLLPENGLDVARALVGSEGTCAVLVGARMRLVPKPPASLLLCLGYRDVVDAARDVPRLLAADPAAVEGIDERIVATMRWRRGDDSVAALPDGAAWLFVELDGADPEEVRRRAEDLLAGLREDGRLVDGRPVPDADERTDLWRVREDGAGLSSRLAPTAGSEERGAESWPGWEDSAVAPERLADYLVDLRALLDRHGLDGVMYGHFGAGCMHVRITFDLRSDAGRTVFAAFLDDAARLVVRHGGSVSGEHGDGRARGALLPLMYSPEMLGAFAAFQRVWDPAGVLGVAGLADPAPPTRDLALEGVPVRAWTGDPVGATGAAAGSDQDPYVREAQYCIGVGRCRTSSGGVMCPSYRATRDEKDSTRGRARVLQDMLRTAPSVEAGWRSEDVREALDLCLSCKACSTDCPTGVDMAALKSRFLDGYYAGRMRPRSHYVLGRLPVWLGLAARAPRLANALLHSPLSGLGMRLAGLTTQRSLPAVADRRAWQVEAAAAGAHRPGSGTGDVVVVADSFTRAFRPQVVGALAALVAASGESAECAPDLCCGLPWISTGQLDGARRRLRDAATRLDDGTHRPVVVAEPSCASALREDLPRLVDSDAARRVAARVRSVGSHALALAEDGRLPAPAAPPTRVVLQTHCHEYATFGARVQRRVLAAAGVTDVVEATGCCGVAGNFGVEAEHHDLSVAVAEHALAPALRESGEETPVLTDGFSCSTQVTHLAPQRRTTHLAELLDPRTPPRKDVR